MKRLLTLLGALLFSASAFGQTAMVPCVTQTDSGGFSSCAPVTATNQLPVAVYSNSTAGFVLTSNGSGAATFQAGGGGGGTPGGSPTQLQYNNSGSFGGLAGSSIDGTGSLLGLGSVTPTVTFEVQDNPTLLAPPTGFTASLSPEVLIGSPSDVVSFLYGPLDPSSCSANENGGSGSIYVANGQTLNYIILSFDTINITNYSSPGIIAQCSMTDTINDGVTNFTVGVSWPTSTNGDGSPVTGYIPTGPFGSFNAGSGTSYTDDGTPQSASWVGFGGMTSAGQSFAITPFNLANALGSGQIYSSPGGTEQDVTESLNNGSQFWLVHTLSGNSGTNWTNTLLYDSVANGYTTTGANLFYQMSPLGGGTNPYPFHYGIQADGSALNQVLHAYSEQLSPLLFSSAFATATTVDPGDGQYYYIPVGVGSTGGGVYARILRNINGAGFSTYYDTTTGFNYTALSPTWISGSNVSPNNTPSVAAIFQNSAAALSDAPEVVATTNALSGAAPGFGVGIGTQIVGDWRWNPNDGNMILRSNEGSNGIDFGFNNTIYHQFNSNVVTLNFGRQNFGQLILMNPDGSDFLNCQTNNNFCEVGGHHAHTSNPLLSVLGQSGQTGIGVELPNTSSPIFNAYAGSANVFQIDGNGYITAARISNGTTGLTIGSSSADKLGFFGGSNVAEPNGVSISSALQTLNLVLSPTAVKVTEGGTGLTSGTSGGIPFFSSTSTMGSSAVLQNHQLLVGGGSGAGPATLGGTGTATQVLHGGVGNPSFSALVLTTDVSGILPKANGGTGNSSGTADTLTNAGSATLVSGTTTVSISGLTSSNLAVVSIKTPGGTLGAAYKAVCTTNTLTITAITTAGVTVITDTSTLTYAIVK